MSDLTELFQRDPLTYSKEGAELQTIIEEMRRKRAQFNLGNIKAGTTKPLTAKAAETLSLAKELKGGLDL